MAPRKIKDAKDLSTNELIYFKSHAKATFMSDGVSVEDKINNFNNGTDLLINVTHSELKTLRNNSLLVPGQRYRITDFETTTTQSGTASAGHRFDIIVEATDTNMLSNEARACLPTNPAGDVTISEYYTNNKLVPDNWNNVNIENIPEGIKNLPNLGFTPTSNSDIRTASAYKEGYDITCNAGYLGVSFNWESDESGTYPSTKKINCVGIELVDTSTQLVIASDFHIGSTGTSQNKNTYTVIVPKTGVYNIRFYIIVHPNYDNGILNSLCNMYTYRCTTYFENTDLSAWELKYSLDDDSNMFDWSNKTSGKGFIYYMKDEYNNECAYDFKNITYSGQYTFNYNIDGTNYDGSVKYGNLCYSNSILLDVSGANGKLGLPKTLFKNTSNTAQCHTNKVARDNWNIIFGNNCYHNTFGERCQNTTLGNNCNHNSFGCGCESNTLGDHCSNNSFGCNCSNNKLKANCVSNKLLYGCTANEFGEYCQTNIFTSTCDENIFGDGCYSNTFDIICTNNHFGNNCYLNKFGNNCSYNTISNYCYGNSFGCNCNYLNINENINSAIVSNNISGTSDSVLTLNIEPNLNYETKVTKNSKGDIKIYCEADLIL